MVRSSVEFHQASFSCVTLESQLRANLVLSETTLWDHPHTHCAIITARCKDTVIEGVESKIQNL